MGLSLIKTVAGRCFFFFLHSTPVAALYALIVFNGESFRIFLFHNPYIVTDENTCLFSLFVVNAFRRNKIFV